MEKPLLKSLLDAPKRRLKDTKEPWGVGDKGKTVLKTYSPTKAKILVEGVNFFQ